MQTTAAVMCPEAINPLDYPACLAQPLRLTHSTWIQHVPFGMFLVEVLRPQVLVELGAYMGVSYCAFCQAIKALGLDASCYAVDTWAGDHQSGYYGEEVLTELRAHHDPLYGDFSRLVRSDFDAAREHFADGVIDLLHIDGLHTYEAVAHDFEGWLPKMSESGVMLFHDTNVREGDFGVWRLWAELKAEYPHFEMLHGHGLGVLAVGRRQPTAMVRLLGAPEEETVVIRDFFYRLGQDVEKTREVRELREQVRAQDARLAELQSCRQKLQRLEGSALVRAYDVWARQGVAGLLRKGAARVRRS